MALGGSSLLSQVTSFLGQTAVQAITAGVLTGVVGGSALVASGALQLGGTVAPQSADLLACPGSGVVLATIDAGASVLVTGRSADGQWLQVYVGQPGLDRAWIPAGELQLQSSGDGLAVSACAAPGATIEVPESLPPLSTPVVVATVSPEPSPSPSPEASPTISPSPTSTLAPGATPRATPKTTPKASASPSPSPSPSPSASPSPSPSPSPTATPFVDNTFPTLSNLHVTNPPADINDGKFYVYWPTATCTPHSFTVAVTATDPDDAVGSVTLYYAPAGSGTLSVGMSPIGGNVWSVTVPTSGSWGVGQIGFFAQSVDSHGNHSGATYSSNYLTLTDQCFG